MSLERVIAWAFLGVSLFGCAVQSWALRRVAHAKAQHRGLARTSVCRVGCALIYTVIGLNALYGHWHVLAVTFAAFCITQLTWAVNGWLDVRIAHPRPRHRRFITITISRETSSRELGADR